MTAWTSCPVAPPFALVPNTHERGTSGVLFDRRAAHSGSTPRPRRARGWTRMIGIAREAVRGLDLAIDFGTASVRVTADSQHVRERRSADGEHRALAGGVVVDRKAASEVLRPMLYRARRWAGF